MRVALGQFNEMTHERLTFAKQLGVSGCANEYPNIALLKMDIGNMKTCDVYVKELIPMV